ncbi:MAG: tetratricopeptide repeat protein [Sulfurovum sp.]
MQINGYITVRCGCFESNTQAKSKLKELKVQYPQAQLARTCKYRFGETCPTPKKSNEPLQESHAEDSQEEELRLMLQVFLYKNDLENAYKVAQIGYSQHPNSYYWNKKMADILQWTGRSARAMTHLEKMYRIRYDPQIEKKLIDYGKATFQYEIIEPIVLNRVRHNPTQESIDLLITIYKQTGFPEKAITIMDQEYQRTDKLLFVSKALELSIETGELELAKRYISIIEQQERLSKQDAVLVARYYYILRDIKHALSTLEKAHNGDIFEAQGCSSNVEYLTKEYFSDQCIGEITYFELKSDLSWYLQKNLAAAKTSLVLVKSNVARLEDYERVAWVYQDLDADLAAEAVRLGYLKYKHSYMFFSYANSAITKKRFDKLNNLIQTIDEEHSPLAKEAMYWIIKLKLYSHYKKYDLEKSALGQALKLSSETTEIKKALLWHFMEINDVKNTKLMLLEFEKGKPSSSLYFTLASAYFYTHNIDRASYYMDKLKLENNIIIHTLEYKFLQAYIYQVQTRDELFQTKMIEIFKLLKKQRETNPALKTDNEHLINYLNAAMYVMDTDRFEKSLQNAKPYLKKKNYDELAYSWAMQKKAFAKSHAIYNQAHTPELWMQFSNAIVMQHHTDTENLLDRYLSELSQGDASYQAREDGQIALAQTINYDICTHNNYNQNSYIAQLDLTKQRSDVFDLKLSRYIREPLIQNYAKITNSSYIGDNWYILGGFSYYQNSSSDTNTLLNVPKTTYNASLGVKKLTERALVKLDLIYNHDMKNYLSAVLNARYRLSTDFTAGVELANNKKVDESTQLYLGGKKDLIALSILHQILDSTSIEFKYELSRFSSQDNVDLGDKKYFSASINRRIRNGYPDTRIALFYNNGSYNETSGSKGIIDRLQIERYAVLPNDFYNIGFNFSYGETNKELYTRVWRPYFELFPYYNSDTDDFTYGFNAGIGGKVFHQDHMSLGFSYTDSFNGVGGKIFKFYIDYQFLYTLSKEI